MKALKIGLNNISLIEIDSSSVKTELEGLQQAVGGYIETVRLPGDSVMIVDEEGLLKQYPRNDLASIISKNHIYGTALIVGIEGDALCDVPEEYLSLLSIGEV